MKSKKLQKYYLIIILTIFITILWFLLLKNINNKKTIGITEIDKKVIDIDKKVIENVIVDKVETDSGSLDIKVIDNNTFEKEENIQKITKTGTIISEENNIINIDISSDLGINTLENVSRNK